MKQKKNKQKGDKKKKKFVFNRIKKIKRKKSYKEKER